MDVAILVHDGVSAAEALAPAEVFGAVPDVAVHFVAHRTGPHATQGRPGVLVADRSVADWPDPDTLVVPGGLGVRRLVEDDALLAWIADAHRTSQWTAGISTGVHLLGAAGVLDGCDATGHWLLLDELRGAGAVASAERLVRHGRVITASGATSAFDLALLVVERTFGAEVAERVRAELADDPDGSRQARRHRWRPRAGRHRSAGRYVMDDELERVPGAGPGRPGRRRRRGQSSPSSPV